MKKILFLLFLISALNGKAQLGGIGFTPLTGLSGEGKRFAASTLREDLNYGIAAYKEGYGFLFNTQIGVGYLHQTYSFSDTASQSFLIGRDYLQIIPSFKYWFGNAMRAGEVFGLKCAHKTKIVYNYAFKPYLIFGLPYNILLNKKSVAGKTESAFRKSGFSFLGGIGSNIIEIGGNNDPVMVFIEFRMLQELNEFISSPSDHYGFAFQAVLGLKFERD